MVLGEDFAYFLNDVLRNCTWPRKEVGKLWLISSPVCLVTDEYELGAHMQRILKAAGQDLGAGKPIMEIDPDHPMLRRVATLDDDETIADWAHVLYGQAVLSEGGQLDDGAAIVQRLNRLLGEPTHG